MQFFRKLFCLKTYSFIHLSKEVFIALFLIIFPIFYPSTAHAGIFSYFSTLAGNEASAKIADTNDGQNSQNMTVLKAAANANPTAKIENTGTILASGNALQAEIGPSGTIAEIPEQVNTQISLYVVRPGDTLSQIAEMFDVSINTIIWANDLGKNAAIKPGQTLLILPITGIKYTVKKGDTIEKIVKKYKADLEEVLLDNDLSINSVLKEGDTIIIPDAEPAAGSIPVIAPSSKPNLAGYFSSPIVMGPKGAGHKSQGLHGNNGVDLAAPVGTTIYAAAGGTVIASMKNGAWNGGYGNYVIISHPNGTQTLYAHNSINLVSVGQSVDKGQAIARIGMTGKTTGPHVHFEVRGARNPF